MQSKEGARKARDKNLAKDPDYYKNIGSVGGKAPHSLPTGYGSKKVGPDGLTGLERARKLAKERKL